MPYTFDIDHTRATVLGFSKAGWNELQKDLKKKHIESYTTTENIIAPDKSIYWKHHPKNILEKKASSKKKEPESVRAALETLGSIFMKIEEQQTRENLVRYFWVDVMKNDLKDLAAHLLDINKSSNPNEALLSLLVDITTDGSTIPESATGSDGEVDLTGYRVASCLRMMDPNLLSHHLHKEDKKLVGDLKTWCDHSNLEATPYETQHGLAQSKGAVVDTLQANIALFKQGLPLIPIMIVVSSEHIVGVAQKFFPNWELATSKKRIIYTNAEVRMVYKLTEEIGDPFISALLNETVFFMHQEADGFKQIPAPWQEQNAACRWEKRTRSHNQPAYKNREPSAVPEWVKELSALSQEALLTRPIPIYTSVTSKH